MTQRGEWMQMDEWMEGWVDVYKVLSQEEAGEQEGGGNPQVK